MPKRLYALLVAGATLAACSESSQPTGAIPVPIDINEYVTAQLTCQVDAVASTMSCAPANPAAVSGRSNDLILGGQNVYVKLASTINTSNATTIDASVTVKNLTILPWNTDDGTTIAASGVKVFFEDGPTNGVVVANPTATDGSFTNSGQTYFQYSGADLGADGILSSGETSLPRNWIFTLNGASTFTFGVLIVAKMPNQTGVLRFVGDTLQQSGVAESRLSIWGSSGMDIWAGGPAGGTAFQHYDGTAWTSFASATPVNGLWGSVSDDIWAATSTRLQHYRGAGWVVDPFIAPDVLNAIWGYSESQIYAGGANGTLVQYDGFSWSNVANSGISASEEVTAIFGTLYSDVYVGTVTATAGLGLHRWNGLNWSIVPAGITAVRAIWGPNQFDIYVGGDFGLLRHWDGSSWSTISGFGTSAADAIQGIWGSATNNVYLVQRSGMVWHSVDYGVTWFPYTNAGVGLLAIWGADDHNVFLAGFGNGATTNNVVIRGVR